MAGYEQPGFIATIIGPDGRPIREHNENGRRVARLPFGSEYKVRLQNKSLLRALVGVEIDGTNVTSAGKIILHAGESVDLERFLENLNGGSKFKFVEASNGAVQDPTAMENGRIRVTFEGELLVTTAWCPPIQPSCSGVLRGMGFYGAVNNTAYISSTSAKGMTSSTQACVNSSAPIMDAFPSDAGATVDGGHSSQQFNSSNEYFPVNAPIYIDLWLKGLQPVLYNVCRQGSGIQVNGHYFEHGSVTIEGGKVRIELPADKTSVRL